MDNQEAPMMKSLNIRLPAVSAGLALGQDTGTEGRHCNVITAFCHKRKLAREKKVSILDIRLQDIE